MRMNNHPNRDKTKVLAMSWLVMPKTMPGMIAANNGSIDLCIAREEWGEGK